MTSKSLQERLCEYFNSLPLVRPSSLSPLWLKRLHDHSVWLRTEGRFGERLVRKPGSTTTFNSVDLDGANFARCEIRNMILTMVNLRYASFAGATLRNVEFVECDLEGADFTDAQFKDVTFKSCLDIDRAKFGGSKDLARVVSSDPDGKLWFRSVG